MGSVVFSNNAAEWTRVEGLSVSEDPPPTQIRGVVLNRTGVAGECVRGPVNKRISISGEGRFKEVFGGRSRDGTGAITGLVWKALLNKRFGGLDVIRAAAASAATARKDFSASTTPVLRVEASSPGAWGLDITAAIEAATDGDGTHFNVKVTYLGTTVTFKNVNISGTSDNTSLVVGTDDGRLVQLTKLAAGRPDNAGAVALAGGGDGAVLDVGTPTVTPQGTPGSTSYSYKVVAIAGGGKTTAASAAGSTSAGNATLTGSNFNRVQWTAVAGAQSYDVYRTVSAGTPSSLGKIGSVSAGATMQLDDTGLVGDASTAPSSNTTANIADSDFTAAGKGMPLLAAAKDLGVVFVAERSSATIKSTWATLMAGVADKMALICADSETVAKAAAITDAALNRSDRLIYCFNHTYTLDPEATQEVVQQPTSWAASILNQTDVDIHIGEEDSKVYTAGITRLFDESLSRDDYADLRAAGISALEKDDGFVFRSGVTTSITPGKEEITRRRMTDYLQLSIAAALKFSVKKKNTATRRKTNGAMVTAFLDDLKNAERIVEKFVVDTEKKNTESSRAAGLEILLVRVRLLPHMLWIVLKTEIGTTVQVTEAA